MSVRPKPSTPFQKLPRFWIVPIPLPRKGQPRSHIRGRSGDAPHRPRCQPCVPLPPRYRHGISICSVRLQGRVAVEQAARTMSKQRLESLSWECRHESLPFGICVSACVGCARAEGQKKKEKKKPRGRHARARVSRGTCSEIPTGHAEQKLHENNSAGPERVLDSSTLQVLKPSS